jgi:hypothetical protein
LFYQGFLPLRAVVTGVGSYLFQRLSVTGSVRRQRGIFLALPSDPLPARRSCSKLDAMRNGGWLRCA